MKPPEDAGHRHDRRDVVAVAALVLAAAALRTLPSASACLGPDYVSFQDDAWYHMRRVDHLVANFPHGLTLDPYALAGGLYVPIAPLLDLIVAALVRLVAGTTPATREADVVAALVPPILGALTAIPAFLLARRLFGRLAALFAAAFAALGPGPFLERSLVGYTDHHVLEVLLTAFTLHALSAAADASRARGSRRVALPLAAGVLLAAYLLSWSGGAFLVFVVCGWGLVQTALERAHGFSAPTIARVIGPCFAMALALVLALQAPTLYRYQQQAASLVLGLFVAVSIALVRRIPRLRGGPAYGVGALLLLGLAAPAGLLLLWPDLARSLWTDASRLRPAGAARTIAEIAPLLERAGRLDLAGPWHVYSTPLLLALPALAALCVRAARRAEPHASLLAMWSAAALTATLVQNRFGYYLCLAVALLAGAACAAVVGAARSRGGPMALAVAGLGLAAALAPAAMLALRQSRVAERPPREWHSTLSWLRQNTPEPFGSGDFYTKPYSEAEARARPDYAVLAWWDYGYWITRVARRVPVANPTQAGAEAVARFLLEDDSERALARLEEMGARYVVVNRDLLFHPARRNVLMGGFRGVVEWAGERRERYYASFAERGADGAWRTVVLFFPDYFETAVARLYLHGGEAAEPQDSAPVVVSYREVKTAQGPRRDVLKSRAFRTYSQAAAYLAELGPGSHVIASRSPLRTCVPLRRMEGLRLVHEAEDADQRPFGKPSVRVFERR